MFKKMSFKVNDVGHGLGILKFLKAQGYKFLNAQGYEESLSTFYIDFVAGDVITTESNGVMRKQLSGHAPTGYPLHEITSVIRECPKYPFEYDTSNLMNCVALLEKYNPDIFPKDEDNASELLTHATKHVERMISLDEDHSYVATGGYWISATKMSNGVYYVDFLIHPEILLSGAVEI